MAKASLESSIPYALQTLPITAESCSLTFLHIVSTYVRENHAGDDMVRLPGAKMNPIDGGNLNL